MNDTMPLVRISDLHKEFRRGAERIEVLRGVDLDLAQGDFLALMGPSGSGKTTLLNMLGGLDTPTRGTVAVGGERIDRLSGGRELIRNELAKMGRLPCRSGAACISLRRRSRLGHRQPAPRPSAIPFPPPGLAGEPMQLARTASATRTARPPASASHPP